MISGKWFNFLQSKLFLSISAVLSKLIFQKISDLRVKRAATRWQKLTEINIKHSKITRRFELDIGPRTTERTVECISTLDR